MHESNFHYILKIISSQDEKITCKAPCKYFANYQFKKAEIKNSKHYDGGDFGEALIFGEKIYEISMPGAEKILDNQFWKRKNIDFSKSGTDFIKINSQKKKYCIKFRELSTLADELTYI